VRPKPWLTGVVAVAVLAAAQASHGARTSPRVGRWQTVRTCQGLVDALAKLDGRRFLSRPLMAASGVRSLVLTPSTE
jgi:hypothetical protein